MKRISAVVLGLLLSSATWGQIHLNQLTIKKGETYTIIGSDILVVDDLIMEDGSTLVLNSLKPENYLRFRSATFGKECKIDGRGVPGLKGRPGRPGISPNNPCTDGGPGTKGTEGTYGGNGTNVFIYLSDIKMNGSLFIDVSGGDGGDGGNGGNGGGGTPGTRVCKGGDGGASADGSAGGQGGNSGTVSFIAPAIPELRNFIGDKITVHNYGGNGGFGGQPGAGGLAGLSSVGNSKLDGKTGKRGVKGINGVKGNPAAILFPDK
ncbi:hypothetical protein BH09BAC3_BH09BAC3_16780 [soil metagenome]